MNKAAIFHRRNGEYILPIDGQKLFVRLLAARDDLASCQIIYWKRTEPEQQHIVDMSCCYRNDVHDDFRTELTLPEIARYIKYCFRLIDKQGQTFYLCDAGFTTQFPTTGYFEFLFANDGDISRVPAWSQGIVLQSRGTSALTRTLA